jgi:hypothetical protein
VNQCAFWDLGQRVAQELSASTTNGGRDAAHVAGAPSDRTRTRRCRSSHQQPSRIRRKRSRICFRSAERAGASAASASRGGTSGRTSWSPQTRRSCRAASSPWNSTHAAKTARVLRAPFVALDFVAGGFGQQFIEGRSYTRVPRRTAARMQATLPKLSNGRPS